jgi:[protein-PII] uridylyltransferase
MVQKNFSNLFRKLKDLRQAFLEASRNDVPGLLAARTYAEAFLTHLGGALRGAAIPHDGWCLAAVGGFGRGELSFASDLDLLFLYHNRLIPPLQDVVRELTYGLWDEGFEVGHATTSVSDAKRLVQEDFSILTSYLEARFIAGDEELHSSWRKAFLKSFGMQRRRRFQQSLAKYRESRLQQFGETSYLLEPHVKEGVGGLRDLQTIRWAGIVFLHDTDLDAMLERDLLGRQEKLWLEQAYDFLWRVRLQLHQLTGRRQDQLLFPEQEQLAARLGYADSQQGLAVEAFMRLYYRHTARIRRTTSFFLERLGEKERKFPRIRIRRRILPGPFLLDGRHLHFLEPDWIRKDPRLLMRFFWQAAQTDAHFHHQAGGTIRENLGAFTDAARKDPQVVKQFFDILVHPRQAFPVLRVMLETSFLDVFLPEFVAVRFRVQHDVYHLYTVDEHLLRTVRELHRMEQNQVESLSGLGLHDLFAGLKHRRILYLVALVHDIGKGQGANHAVRGVPLVRGIAGRLGLNQEETELLCFLVEHHLLLAETALKRDLMDEKPIMKCAVTIVDRERLQMLFLLTIADSRATGPGAWSAWKASLLKELYQKIDRMLARGDWQGDDLQQRSDKIQRAVLELAGEAPNRDKLVEWLDRLSFRYLLSQPPTAILQHFQMEKELAEHPPLVLTNHRMEGEMWQLTVATQDRPGLFAMITGVLWLRGLNILSADIFTRESGVALDVLLVERIPDPLHPEELWGKVAYDLVQTLGGGAYLDELLADKRKPSLLHQKSLPRKEDKVVVDEEASDFYTIIEVYTWDRPGVLHAITNTFYRLGVSIQLAKISTPGAQVADIFYVTDMSGNKLNDPETHERIRAQLSECLSAT